MDVNFPQRTALPDVSPSRWLWPEVSKEGCAHLALEPVFTFTKHSLSTCCVRGSEPLALSIFIYSLHLAR